ncbi:unnamed protein product [Brassica napus]|uniref:glucomannan 4-beta-mannosyltransferase n=1 Tax=Brassica napus TaxID=3708 RepID=A0A817B8G1_BRANA|nr:unnamed protein product [Brassica napus]
MDGVTPKFVLPETFDGVKMEITGQLGMIWELVKAPVIVPLLQLAVYICLLMSLMLLCERVYMGIVIVLVKLFWKKPHKRYKFEPIQDDEELGSSNFPVVLVQIPMFNEREVYKLSIGAASGLSWPSDRLVIQVLDDSTDPTVKQMVEMECQRWASKGINIRYQIRENRVGYKAGALKEGLKRSYVKHCEYVVIFDADFQPEPDFLRRSIPFLVHNPNIALVQARWRFVNSDECLLTRMQEMSLDYHFTVEQEVGSSTHAFFGFNGTAGIWRIAAINEAGGWKDRTTVEDMDLAVRASLRGWKFLYLGDLQVKSELPSTFRAFRFQQHRWSCGPANLFRKMVMEIIRNKKVRFWKKVYVIYSFFFVRKVIAHWVTFCFYCAVLPLTILVPEVKVPIWGSVYIPSIITVLNSVGTPRSIHLLFYWILFENVMSLHRTKATLIGLFEAGRANEWVVTAKLGSGQSAKGNTKGLKKFPRIFKLPDRLNTLELGFAAFLFVCGCYDYAHGKNNYFIYLFLQTMSFFISGLGWIGTYVPSVTMQTTCRANLAMSERGTIRRSGEDWISFLPDPLLCQILSDLPTKNVVITSVLFLDFSQESCLHKLTLSFTRQDDDDPSLLASWIETAVLRKIQHLEVDCRMSFMCETTSLSLYLCETLVSLRLYFVALPSFESLSLPNLKVMHMEENLYADDEILEKLVSSCPVLESLTVVRNVDETVKVLRVWSKTLNSLKLVLDSSKSWYNDDSDDWEVLIDAPRRKYLSLEDDQSVSFVISNVASSAKVEIDVSFNVNDIWDMDESVERFSAVGKMLNGLSSARDMTISGTTLKIICHYMSFEPVPCFPNMIRLQTKLYMTDMLPNFLESFPNLQSLVLKLKGVRYSDTMWFSFVPKCLQTSLEYFEMTRPNCGAGITKLVKYLLENSVVLKKFTLRLECEGKEQESDVVKELMRFRRCSSACVIKVVRLEDDVCIFEHPY